jgi:hypothetical protein
MVLHLSEEKIQGSTRIEIRGVSAEQKAECVLVKDAAPARKKKPLEGRRESLSAVWPEGQALHQSCG